MPIARVAILEHRSRMSVPPRPACRGAILQTYVSRRFTICHSVFAAMFNRAIGVCLPRRIGTLVLALLLSGAATAASDDLHRFLARIGKPITSQSASRNGVNTAIPAYVGATCKEQEGIRICQVPESGEIVSFSIINSGSPRIVPKGLERSYRLRFQGYALHNAKMMIQEKSKPTGKDSHFIQRTSLYFFPRKTLPTLKLIESSAKGGVLELRLPTGERVCFDRNTKQIVGGVLREDGPLDANPDRYHRHFARVSYKGRGVMIRVDQRGETPEEAAAFGVAKRATILFGNRTCRVSPSLLWEQTSGWYAFRFPTDAGFYAFLQKTCRWNKIDFQTEIADDSSTCMRPAAEIEGKRP